RIAVGKLRDLQVLSRGVSGRVAELRVIGSRGDTVVRGFDVRRLLDLRESLTVVEIQRDSKGQIVAAVRSSDVPLTGERSSMKSIAPARLRR
ncbi:hypothetical protein N9971_00915, partial [bacterium]|nr:hypothetical protein [bacterium]